MAKIAHTCQCRASCNNGRITKCTQTKCRCLSAGLHRVKYTNVKSTKHNTISHSVKERKNYEVCVCFGLREIDLRGAVDDEAEHEHIH